MLRPLGPVAVFGASNFPLAFSVAGGDTISVLAAGCPVVFKAHPAHPGTCELVAKAIHAAVKSCGMPPGTFSMLQGRTTEVGQHLVRHPAINAVAFTGSFRGGKALFDAAVTRKVPIPVFAEMGSSNPVFILPRMLRERSASIARDLATSVTLGVGQFCTNPGLVFLVSSDDTDSFLEQLSGLLNNVPAGVMLTEAIAENYRSGVEVRSTIGSMKVRRSAREESKGLLGQPVLLETDTEQFLGNEVLQEEIFGPSTLAVTAKTKDDLLRAAASLHGHLTATIHGTHEDFHEYTGLMDILEQKVGRIIVNGYPTGVEVCNSMVHGGPFPATTDSRATSVGTAAITRFARPVCYQDVPASLLPEELKDENPLRIMRIVNGQRRK
jgi:NADP-dependent aldehyde dehydrogenase